MIIRPCGPGYIVKHEDLSKFGVDGTIHASAAQADLSPANSIAALSSPFYMPTIKFGVPSSDAIEIKRTRKHNDSLQSFTLKVDRDTGIPLASDRAFHDIAMFDPKTFPEKSSEWCENVGYWDSHGAYKPPKASFNPE